MARGIDLAHARRTAAMFALMALSLPPTTFAQDARSKPSINVAAIVLIEPMTETPLPIQVGPPDALPRNSFVRVKGLPAQAVFSDGHFVSAGTWALPLAGLSDLKITVPLSTSGRTDLQLTLLAIDGAVLAESKVTLAVTAGTLSTPGTAQAPPAARAPSSASLGPPGLDLSQPPRPALQRVEPPTAPAMKPEERERAAKMMARGDAEIAGGDIMAARMLYQRAADAGMPEAAMAMGGTYDPSELARRGVKGLKGDPDTARKWYERARSLGAPGAEERLRRVGAP